MTSPITNVISHIGNMKSNITTHMTYSTTLIAFGTTQIGTISLHPYYANFNWKRSDIILVSLIANDVMVRTNIRLFDMKGEVINYE